MTPTERALLRNELARRRVEQEDAFLSRLKNAYDTAHPEDAEKDFARNERRREERRILKRLRAVTCDINTIDDLEDHLARIARTALAAKQNPRNDYAEATL